MTNVVETHRTAESEFDYAGYATVDNLKLTQEDLKKAFDIMWDLVMVASKDERNAKYLFTHGIIKSKDIFLERKAKQTPEMSSFQKDSFEKDAKIFMTKLQNMEALVHFLIKLKEVI